MSLVHEIRAAAQNHPGESIKALEDAINKLKCYLALLGCDEEFIGHETEKAQATVTKLNGV